MEYLLAGWPPELIRHRLDLTEQQMTDAVAYIDTHRAEVEAEYQTVLQHAQEIRRYWEERNRERSAHIAAQPSKPEEETLRKEEESRRKRRKTDAARRPLGYRWHLAPCHPPGH